MDHEPLVAGTPADLLLLSRKDRATTKVVHASGEIDMSTAPMLSDALTEFESAADRPDRVVLDLGDITFMSSDGLKVLNMHERRFAELGIRFVVVAAQRAVLHIFEITGMSEVVTVVPDVEQAIALP
jgi:anti-anti-sigma factor